MLKAGDVVSQQHEYDLHRVLNCADEVIERVEAINNFRKGGKNG